MSATEILPWREARRAFSSEKSFAQRFSRLPPDVCQQTEQHSQSQYQRRESFRIAPANNERASFAALNEVTRPADDSAEIVKLKRECNSWDMNDWQRLRRRAAEKHKAARNHWRGGFQTGSRKFRIQKIVSWKQLQWNRRQDCRDRDSTGMS